MRICACTTRGSCAWRPTAPVAAVTLGLALGRYRRGCGPGRRGPLSSGSEQLLRDRAVVQLAIGEATAAVGAARSGVIEATQRAWDDPEDAVAAAAARLLYVHAGRASLDAVQRLFHAVGTPAAMRAHPIERRLRDLYLAMQFPAFSQSVVLGGGPGHVGARTRGTGLVAATQARLVGSFGPR